MKPDGVAGLSISNLTAHRGEFRLTAVDWQVSPGQLVAVVGVNGAGKTTLLQSLTGMAEVDTGSLSLAGIPLDEFGWRLPEAIGLVPDALLGIERLSLRHHLELAAEMSAGWDRVYAAELLARLQVPTDKQLRHLSRGNRAKAAFVLAEASRPIVLALDEPTSGLDPIVREELLTVLREIIRTELSRIVIFSTHILDDIVEIATGISLVRRGEVLAPRFDDGIADWRACPPSERTKRIADLFERESFG